MSEITYTIPPDWHETLTEYIRVIKTKDEEQNKRAYFKSKIMEGVFKIDPRDIQIEEKRTDLYYAGVLFETKKTINQATRADGLSKLSKYVEERKNAKLCVLTDLLHFEIYDPDKLDPKKVKLEFDIDKMTLDETQEDYERRVFNQLYRTLYSDLANLKPEPSIIVPRIKSLIDRWTSMINIEENNIKYVAWRSYVSKAFGSETEATVELFKKHALLYYTAVILSARAIGYSDKVKDILEGAPFIADGILNYVEEDAFFDFLPHAHKFFDELDEEVRRYDFKEGIANDVFLILYEDLISPSQRHNLGEYYTPEWLARILVEKAVERDDIALDPACGSGTFLRCIIERKRELGKKPDEIYKETLGFDINPIAVAVSKANYLITMKSMDATPEIIPVFLADSLMPLTGSITENIGEFISEDWAEIMIDFGEIVSGAGQVPFRYRKEWGIKEITQYIAGLSNGKDEYNLNKQLLEKIELLKKQGKNHVWFYIIRNIYTPYYYRHKVDLVIGNPPWLTYRDVKNTQRQRFLDELYEGYGMKAGARNKANQDMAGFFIVRCKEYLKQGGKIAFVVTRAIFNGDQYNGLRRRQWNLKYSGEERTSLWLKYIWDIESNPFHKPSCMILLGQTGNTPSKIPGEIIGPKQRVDIRRQFTPETTPQTFYVNLTSNFSSISTTRMQYLHTSAYSKYFKRGATIFPRPYYFVSVEEEKAHGVRVSTDLNYTTQANKRRRKGDFEFSFDKAWVPKSLVYSVILGEDIKPFECNLSRKAVLPIEKGSFIFDRETRGQSYTFILKSDYENDKVYQLYRGYEALFNQIEKDWEAHRGEKFSASKTAKESSRMSVLDWLNYSNKLLVQAGKKGNLVVYNKSGQTIKSAVVENAENVIVEDTAYYSYFEDKHEAYYICGVLNSKHLLDILRKTGILSERDIHKKPFDIPIPEYDSKNKIHNRIANLSIEITALLKQNADGRVVDSKKKELEALVKALLSTANQKEQSQVSPSSLKRD